MCYHVITKHAYIPIYTLLPYKEVVIDNFKNEIIFIGRNDLYEIIIVKTSHAIMNLCTNIHLLPHVECTIMTVVIKFLFIIIHSYII